MMKSWRETKRGPASRLVAYVDEANPMIAQYKAIIPPKGASIEFGPYKTMVQVVNYFSCEKYRDFEYYHEINDDHVCRTEGWDIKMMEAIDRKNMGVAVCYGNTQNMPTSTMHGAILVHALGYFFPPDYKHSWVDCWLTSIGFKTNIMTHLPEVNIEHMHPAFGKAVKDDTYRAVEEDYKKGELIFTKWYNSQCAADVKMIGDLIDRMRVVAAKKVPNIYNEELSVMMTTYNRYDLLERTVRSYLKTEPRPRRLYVFDDCSNDLPKIKALTLRIPEVVLVQSEARLGCVRKNLASIKAMFEAGADNLLVLDSDCVFSMDWYKMALEIIRARPREGALHCLFNAKIHAPLAASEGGLVEKVDIGGLGLIITRPIFEKYLAEMTIAEDERTNWDGALCALVRKDGGRVYACSPSMLEHTGACEGEHPNPAIVAADFQGEVSFTAFELSHPFKLRYIGEKVYRGFDDNGSYEFEANFMDTVQVTREKARQLLQDGPARWMLLGCLTEDSLY
ncbi:MAG: glycosyltransferase [Patescibacteria group bacterium]